ncbi:MAG: serine/threonine protein kinase [Lentisphaerae bacterium]|nr:serine/threonine protein kinase [Lentisphaerota bacterium]MCP4103401.1 serine/threonine protein kinase [Lentisphaerota bacterium]
MECDGGEKKENRGIVKISCFSCSQKLDVTAFEPFSKVNCPSCGVELIVPRWFGHFLLEGKWAEGGMSYVYRAIDPTLDREVAIKILKRKMLEEENLGEAFIHEGQLAARINNSAVVPIFSCGYFNDEPYLVMQFLERGSIGDLVDSGVKLSTEEVVKWGLQATRGLQAALKDGIEHHDVKTHNIFLNSEEQAKIGDFGLAYAIKDAASEKIASQTSSWGSPAYASPEKLLNGKEDWRGDVFSLGVTFYEMLTGKEPFGGRINETGTGLNLDYTPIEALRSEAPEDLIDLITQMLELVPVDRPDYGNIIQRLEKLESSFRKKRKFCFEAISGKVKIAAASLIILFLLLIVFVIVFSSREAKEIDQRSWQSPLNFLNAGFENKALNHSKSMLCDANLPVELRKKAGLLYLLSLIISDKGSIQERCALIRTRLGGYGSQQKRYCF